MYKLQDCQDPSYEKRHEDNHAVGVCHAESIPIIMNCDAIHKMRTVIVEEVRRRNMDGSFFLCMELD